MRDCFDMTEPFLIFVLTESLVSRDNTFGFSSLTAGNGGRGGRGGGRTGGRRGGAVDVLLSEDPSTATRSGRIVCPPVRMSSPEEILTSVQVCE